MSNKKNLPNIPIYIGDWERDCNVLSLESEAAWMRIVFKLWTKGKQNSIKIPAKSLQNLWRCNEQKMDEILQDLIYNEICEIVIGGGFIEFTCRRFVKENQLSEIRSEAAKSPKKYIKNKAKPKQTKSKKEQNTENDIDYENENVIKTKSENKKSEKSEIVFPFSQPEFLEQWSVWKDYKKQEFNFKYKTTQSEQAALKDLNTKSNANYETAIEMMHQSMANGWKGFFEIKNKTNGTTTTQVQYSDNFKRRIAEKLQS